MPYLAYLKICKMKMPLQMQEVVVPPLDHAL